MSNKLWILTHYTMKDATKGKEALIDSRISNPIQ